MLFVIFLVLAIGGWILYAISEKNYSAGCTISGAFAGVIGTFGVIISLVIILCNQTGVDAKIERMEVERESLVYQYENDMYAFDHDNSKYELMNDICDWNATIAANRLRQDNIWIGIYIPNIYDQIEPIELRWGVVG